MQEEARKSSLTEALAKSAAHEDDPGTDLERFFRTLKHMTVNRYSTSAIGIHQDLQYQGNTYLSAFPSCDLHQISRNRAAKQEERRGKRHSQRHRGIFSDERGKRIEKGSRRLADMKYGVNTMVWTTRITEQHSSLFSRIREWGVDGVDLFLSPSEPASIPAVKRILDGVGLERTSCCVLPREANLIDADPQARARGGEFLKRCIERTAELGCKLICGPLYAALGMMSGRRRTDDEWKLAVEGLHAAAERARKFGITLCVEPLNRFETYFLCPEFGGGA